MPFPLQTFGLEEVLVKGLGVYIYIYDGSMDEFSLKMHSLRPCLKSYYSRIQHGGNNGFGVIRLGFLFTMEVIELEQMLLNCS